MGVGNIEDGLDHTLVKELGLELFVRKLCLLRSIVEVVCCAFPIYVVYECRRCAL